MFLSTYIKHFSSYRASRYLISFTVFWTNCRPCSWRVRLPTFHVEILSWLLCASNFESLLWYFIILISRPSSTLSQMVECELQLSLLLFLSPVAHFIFTSSLFKTLSCHSFRVHLISYLLCFEAERSFSHFIYYAHMHIAIAQQPDEAACLCNFNIILQWSAELCLF